MFDEIDEIYIKNHTFSCVQSEIRTEKEHMAYRFSEGDIIPPSAEEKATILRKKLSELVFTKFE